MKAGPVFAVARCGRGRKCRIEVGRVTLADDVFMWEQVTEPLYFGSRVPASLGRLDDAPAVVYGWCRNHGERELDRDELLAAAHEARDGKVRHVIARR